jgi:carbamoyltransferase
MYVLGINAFHAGSSACLIRDGELVAAVEEERFRRLKYWAGFPVESIRYCLKAAGIAAQDLDHIGISRDPSAHLYKKILFVLRKRPSWWLIKERLSNLGEVRDLKSLFADAVGVPAKEIRAEIHNVEHHLAHMASAFFVSPFQDAAVASIDGNGDFVSTMIGAGEGPRLRSIAAVDYPHSIGIFFTAVTQWLGFSKFGDEGKIQGLAAYGQPTYVDDLRRVLRLQSNGAFELDLDYFVHWADGVDMTWSDGSPSLGTIYSRKFITTFGPPREPKGEITANYANMAASVQAVLEEAEFHVVRDLQKRTGKKALCLAGGVALNSTFNGKVLPATEFTDIFVQPAAGDAGTSLGAAYYVYHHLLGKPRCFTMTNVYTGPAFSSGVIEKALRERGLEYTVHDEKQQASKCAELIADGNVLGWFQGRMEWGPRALGNRSILADPRRAEMKDILNARIKHREPFRPFAPSILLESVGDYFDQTYPDPFMVKVYNILPHKRREIPAVTHLDGTGRLQTVDAKDNRPYWELIKAFQERTGTPVVLNTSFNENEPIVCRPEEAIDCFLRTKMDALAVGNYLVRKDGMRPGASLAVSGVDATAISEALPAPVAAPSAPDNLVSEMQLDDVPQAVALHMAHLTERLDGEPGKRLLAADYQLLCSQKHGVCLTHRRGSRSQVDGIVVLRWTTTGILQALWRQKPVLALALLTWHLARRPAGIWKFPRAAWERAPAMRVWRMAGSPHPWCILHALVADPGGDGTGRSLVNAALHEARKRGFKYIVTTTYQSRSAANHLYSSSGFSLMLKTYEQDRQVNWYGQPL